jgi:hypothetical protein
MTDNEGKKILEVNKVIVQDRLYEEIYNPITSEAKFVYYDKSSNKIIENPFVDYNDIRYIPIIDDFVRKKVVILPTKAEEYNSEDELLKDIQNYIHKYIDISVQDEQICTWTIPMFWLYDKLDMMIPYLRALGDTGCGKSRLLDVVGGISYRTMMIGGSVTPAILYRVSEKWKGTMIIDEADWKNTDEYSEVIKIINCNQPDRRILRCKGDNYDTIEAFDPYCPRIFATRRNFYDVATESRMLTVQMRETSRDDIPIALNYEFRSQQIKLRNQLLTYRLKNWNLVDSNIKPVIDFSFNIEPRTKQIMYPIAIIFNDRPEIMKKLSEIMKEKETELVKDRAYTMDGVIVNAYLDLLEKGNKNITATDIQSFVQDKGFDKLTSQSIGHHMRSLGFTNKVVNVEGKSNRSYLCDDDLLQKLRKRYSVQNIDIQLENSEKLQRLQKLQKPRAWYNFFNKLIGGKKQE